MKRRLQTNNNNNKYSIINSLLEVKDIFITVINYLDIVEYTKFSLLSKKIYNNLRLTEESNEHSRKELEITLYFYNKIYIQRILHHNFYKLYYNFGSVPRKDKIIKEDIEFFRSDLFFNKIYTEDLNDKFWNQIINNKSNLQKIRYILLYLYQFNKFQDLNITSLYHSRGEKIKDSTYSSIFYSPDFHKNVTQCKKKDQYDNITRTKHISTCENLIIEGIKLEFFKKKIESSKSKKSLLEIWNETKEGRDNFLIKPNLNTPINKIIIKMENKNKELQFKKFKDLDNQILQHFIIVNILKDIDQSKRKNLNQSEEKLIQYFFNSYYSDTNKFSKINQGIFSKDFYEFVNTLNFIF